MRRLLLIVFAVTMLQVVVFGKTQASAGEVDILVEKLVEKGILEPDEAQAILEETRQEAAKEEVEDKSYALPEWVQNTKLKGDMRLRYQWEDKSDGADRHRGRYRFRLGMESKVNDQINVGAGLATGSTDPRSTNQTFANTFETPDIRLDYAYLDYEPSDWATLKGGKIKSIKDVIFRPSDLMWDSDINPEGASLLLAKDFYGTDWFLNTGFWVLDEASGVSSDPFMYVVQPGLKYDFNDKVNLKAAVAYYGFEHVQDGGLDHSRGTNTKSGAMFTYDYDSVSPSVELGISDPLCGYTLPMGIEVPYLGFFGDYVHNPDPPDQNNGYLGGVKLGWKNVREPGNWQVKYMYRRLEKDAWLDTFPDSSAYEGDTDVKGHEATFDYGILDNTTLGLDYYYMEKIKTAGRRHILQVDCNVKF